MDTLVLDQYVSERLIRERRARGIDGRDEVWEGVYIMAPAAGDEHQEIEINLSRPLLEIVQDGGLGVVRTSINLASDPDGWEHDYRIPDVAVFLKDSPAVCHDAFWSGPPDLLVEIISPSDKTRDKLEFYGKLGTRELLIIDRDPWQLELYRQESGKLALVAKIEPGDVAAIESRVLPLQFRLQPGKPRPTIEVTAVNLQKCWTV